MEYSGGEHMARQALGSARRFLQRWNDPFTVRTRDDLMQEAAWIAWRCIDRVRDRSRFPALVRTIARRVRWRALASSMRAAARFQQPEEGTIVLEDIPGGGPDDDCMLEVGGTPVPRSWLLQRLSCVLGELSELNRCLLQSYYEGFSCQELADRHRMSEDCVKVRIHRSRQRVRRELEVLVRAAGRTVEP